MKKIRRDLLLKQALAGKLISVNSYNFDDMHGMEIRSNELPVNIISSNDDFKKNHCNLRRSCFDSSSGYAKIDEKGLIHLIVHSNENYIFRIVQ